MLIIQNLAYTHANKEHLFSKLNLSLHTYQKAALVGNNGNGKSTLLKLIAGILSPSEGSIYLNSPAYYVPQLYGQYDALNIAQALGIDKTLNALYEILNGNLTASNLTALNEDWTIEERSREALAYWGLHDIDFTQPMHHLSGGQKTKIFLAGIAIHQPELILLDEPGNHLDAEGKNLLCELIIKTKATLLIVSHDRNILNLPDTIYELSSAGIGTYGGNYDFYKEQKLIETHAKQEELRHMEKALRKAKAMEHDTAERRQRLDARGKKKQEKAGLPTISMNTLRNQAEKSTARLKNVHTGKTEIMAEELSDLRKSLPGKDQMNFSLQHSILHKGKILIAAKAINYTYDLNMLWQHDISFQILSGERIALRGANGAGKSTLIRLLLGETAPTHGEIRRADHKAISIDQDYSLLQANLTVYEQAQQFNHSALQEHEVKLRLARFLFGPGDWDKYCGLLSGGERMRLLLCCLGIGESMPDLIVLDEPTNNLDIQNLEILGEALHAYKGTLIVVSHDDYFLKEIRVEREIILI